MEEPTYSPDQHLRNLRWILESPHDFMLQKAGCLDRRFFSDHNFQSFRGRDQELLKALDNDNARLNQAVLPVSRRRMGVYAESLLDFYFQNHPDFTLLARNLPVRDNKRSVGEFDFILRHGGETIHLELSIKLYLEIIGSRETQFIGTLRGDTLAKKIARLTEHQLQLSESSPAVKQLSDLGIGQVTPKALLKGFIFSKKDAKCWLKEVEDLRADTPDTLYRIPLSFERMATWSGARDVRILTGPELLIFLHEQWSRERAPVFLLGVVKTGSQLQEINRGFVMPDGWYDESVAFVDNL